jgi:hypothetical protein
MDWRGRGLEAEAVQKAAAEFKQYAPKLMAVRRSNGNDEGAVRR